MKNALTMLKPHDPIWQPIGVFIGIIAVALSTFVAYDIYRRSELSSELTQTEKFSFAPMSSFDEIGDNKVSLSIDGVLVTLL